MKKEILKNLKTLIVAIILGAGVLSVYAWNGPISYPPQGNAYAPINTTATSQTKQGSIWASGFFTTGGGYFGGDVGIGTSAPEARLDVRSGSCYYKLQTEGFYTNCSINTPTYLTISSDTANYNIATALENPTTAKNVILTINSGVKVYSNSTSQPALETGNLPSGSTVTIVNNGTIVGAGGNGGTGGHCYGTDCTYTGTPGGSGGNAVNTTVALTVNNTNGYIYGGGGGGGGGAGLLDEHNTGGESWYRHSGGGGGGGAGRNPGTGGPGGNGPGDNILPGGPGADGTTSSGGSGGATSDVNSNTVGLEYCNSVYFHGGCGGNGGGYGVSGNNGAEAYGIYKSGAGAGGAGGKAINLNGQTITWQGGNNGTQVKGAVQ